MAGNNPQGLSGKQKVGLGVAGSMAAVLAIASPMVSGLEGRTLHAYLDYGGVPTICNGITKDVKLGQTKTNAECDELLAGELGQALRVVDKNVDIPLSVHQRAGLASFEYNVGAGAFKKSNLLKLLNAGRVQEACDKLRLWVFIGKKDCRIKENKCGGIVRRREMERRYCLMTDDSKGTPENELFIVQ